MAGANGAVGMCLVQAAASCGAIPLAVVRAAAEPATRRLLDLGASDVLVAGDASEVAVVAAGAAKNGLDVLVDATGRMDLGQAAQYLNPRGRIVPIAGRNQRIELDQWSFYTRELQLLGFIMSAMTAGELAAAAAWINVSSPAVSVGRVLPFPDAGLAHALVERGELPRLPDHTVGRLVLQP